jgi:outer membrane protein OmpA-like peptidoglycan-associated protein
LVFHFAKLTAQELTIYFQNDSYRIEKVYSEQLKQIVSQGIEAIQLEGFTDHNGSNTYNQSLSEHRVEAVKIILLNNGVHTSTISSGKGKGKHPDTSKSFAEMRCVRIVYTRSQVKVEIKPESVEAQEIPALTISEKVSTLEVGQKLALHNLTFIPGRRYLLAEARPYFVELLNTLQDNPTLKIEIHGHVCCTPNSNQDGLDADTGQKNLSVMRAKYVFESLIRSGIHPERLSYKGFGGSIPLVDEVDERTRQMNRRVEILIVEK